MLVLADRGFPSKPLWEAYLNAGADFLWRVKGDLQLPSLVPVDPLTLNICYTRRRSACSFSMAGDRG